MRTVLHALVRGGQNLLCVLLNSLSQLDSAGAQDAFSLEGAYKQ